LSCFNVSVDEWRDVKCVASLERFSVPLPLRRIYQTGLTGSKNIALGRYSCVGMAASESLLFVKNLWLVNVASFINAVILDKGIPDVAEVLRNCEDGNCKYLVNLSPTK